MELMIYIGNDCLDSIDIEQNFITLPGYVSHFVRMLRKKHEQLIIHSEKEPEFILHNILLRQPTTVIPMEVIFNQNKNVQWQLVAV